MIQLMTATQGRLWLWRHFGRFKICIVASDKFYQRCCAPEGTSRRHKSAVLNEMLVHIQSTMDPQQLATPPNAVKAKEPSGALVPLRAFTFTPMIKPFIHTEEELEALDFLARKLFTLRTSPLRVSLKYAITFLACAV